MKLTHKKFLITSLPFTAASVSVPLIGAVDTAIAGGLGSYHYINSVALGSVIFSTIFWLFNFLGLPALPRSHWAAATSRRNYARFCAAAFLPAA